MPKTQLHAIAIKKHPKRRVLFLCSFCDLR